MIRLATFAIKNILINSLFLDKWIYFDLNQLKPKAVQPLAHVAILSKIQAVTS